MTRKRPKITTPIAKTALLQMIENKIAIAKNPINKETWFTKLIYLLTNANGQYYYYVTDIRY